MNINLQLFQHDIPEGIPLMDDRKKKTKKTLFAHANFYIIYTRSIM